MTKRALTGIASMGILAVTVAVGTPNAFGKWPAGIDPNFREIDRLRRNRRLDRPLDLWLRPPKFGRIVSKLCPNLRR